MRIVHTADWHIGQTLAGYPRDDEHRAALADLARLCVAREADALLVAGDVFDHQNPSGEAQRLFFEALVALKAARPRMTIVVTAGNHDAAGRLEAPGPLLAGMGVHLVGSVRRKDGRVDAARHLVPLAGASGRIEANVLAVSYPTAACLPPARPPSGDDAAHRAEADEASPDWQTRALYAELAAATGAGRDGLPLVVTGHLHVAGGASSEGAERHIFVGGQHAVSPDVFPREAAYVALGHLHKPQAIGRETVRYAGSLFPLSASEIGYDHGVTLVTLDAGRVAVEHLPLPRPVPFLRLPETGEMPLDALDARLAALGLPADLPVARRPFVQPWLRRDGLPAGFRAEVDRIAEAYPVRLLDPRIARPAEAATEAAASAPVVRLAELRPEDLFRRAFAEKLGREPEGAHLAAFRAAEAAAAAGEG